MASLRPAGVARITVGAERLFLLIVGPEEAFPVGAPVAHEEPVAEPPKPVAAAPGMAEPEVRTAQPAPIASPPAAPPRRFLWQTDAELVITFLSGPLAEEVGAANSPAVGTGWRDLAERLALDPDGRLGAALSALASFANLTVYWPVAGTAERVAVELAAVATFSRDGVFAGYRGFGVVRSDDRRPDERPAPAIVTEPEAPVEMTAPEPEPTALAEAVAEEAEPPQVAETTPEPEPPQPVAPAVEPELTVTEAARPPAVQPPARLGDDLDDVARESVEGGGREPVPIAGSEASPGGVREPSASSNVVHLANTPTRILPKRLSGTEQDAFRRIAEALGARARAHEEAQPPAPPGGGAHQGGRTHRAGLRYRAPRQAAGRLRRLPG